MVQGKESKALPSSPNSHATRVALDSVGVSLVTTAETSYGKINNWLHSTGCVSHCLCWRKAKKVLQGPLDFGTDTQLLWPGKTPGSKQKTPSKRVSHHGASLQCIKLHQRAALMSDTQALY